RSGAARYTSTEQLSACGIRDRDDGRVLEPPLDGDRIEALAQALRLPDPLHAKLTPDLGLDDGGSGEDTEARLPEHHQERAVLELAHHCWPDGLRLEPLLERAPQGRVLGREQERRAVERTREPAAMPARERL